MQNNDSQHKASKTNWPHTSKPSLMRVLMCVKQLLAVYVL